MTSLFSIVSDWKSLSARSTGEIKFRNQFAARRWRVNGLRVRCIESGAMPVEGCGPSGRNVSCFCVYVAWAVCSVGPRHTKHPFFHAVPVSWCCSGLAFFFRPHVSSCCPGSGGGSRCRQKSRKSRSSTVLPCYGEFSTRCVEAVLQLCSIPPLGVTGDG